MALNGTAFARVNARVATFLEGDAPDVLVPVTPPGVDPQPFIASDVIDGRVETEVGAITNGSMAVFTEAKLVTNTVWSWDSKNWTVESSEVSPSAGARWRFRTVLVRHA